MKRIMERTVRNEVGASSWDLVLKLLSITLVALFAFSSGVWFGKKLSDSDYQRQALEGEFDKEVKKTASGETHDGDHESESSHDATVDDKEALTDEEVIAAADKALNAEKNAEKSEATGKETSRAVASENSSAHGSAHGSAHDTTAKPDLSAAHKAAVRVANNVAPVDKEKPPEKSRVPQSLPQTVGSSNDVEFTVQVASYPTGEAAKEQVDGLVKKGLPAFPVEATINGKTWYRVSIGSFKTFNEASKFRAQLLKQADLPSAIVQKITR